MLVLRESGTDEEYRTRLLGTGKVGEADIVETIVRLQKVWITHR